ncbi:MAG: deoxyhypusine synthase family protein [Nanoarchaeota archaeon]
MKKVEHIEIKKGMKVDDLVREMKKTGVMQGSKVGKAVDIFEKMIKDKDCKVFMGQAGALVPGGMRNILSDILRNKLIDVFVCTGASLTHDLVEALGYSHFQGYEDMDDAGLYKKGLDRMYNSLMPNKVYEGLEDFFDENFEIFSGARTVKELIWLIGSKISDENSIIRQAYLNKIPIYCPALEDSGIGLIIWGRLMKGKKIEIKLFEDLKEIIDIAWTSKKNGVFYLGGGVPKNYIQQAMQFSPKSASYGVQITTDKAEFGGSSGASLKEGISWGKMDEKGEFVDVIADSTIVLPLIYAALKERI